MHGCKRYDEEYVVGELMIVLYNFLACSYKEGNWMTVRRRHNKGSRDDDQRVRLQAPLSHLVDVGSKLEPRKQTLEEDGSWINDLICSFPR